MTHPDLARELGVLLPCTECMHTRSSGHWCEDGGRFRGDEYCDNCTVRPAILTLLRTLLREERERCAEVALRRVAPDSPDHVAADCTECHDGLMLARDIRALGSNIED